MDIDTLEPTHRSAPLRLVLAGVATVAVTGAVLVAPADVLIGLAACLLFGLVVLHPPAAAYVLIASTPLLAGIDRGSLIPVLRPNEAVLVLLGGALFLRGVIQMWSGARWRFRLTAVDAALALLCVASSVVPLLWEAIRGLAISSDDLLYSLTLWKYYALFLVVRASVRTERQIRRCLWISMWSAAVVAMIAVLQSLKLFGIPHLLAAYYAPFGTTTGLNINRGTSTLASAISTGDVMAFNLAIALALLARGGGPRKVLVALAALFAFGGLATGEFSTVIALVTVVVAIGVLTRTLTRKLVAMVALGSVAALALQPVIAQRLHNFSGGIPAGWADRLANLRQFFWPPLFHHYNFILGLRVSPRIATPLFQTGYVWIESGYTWLLWSGGIPFLIAFFVFLALTLKLGFRISRRQRGATGVAAMATFAALVAVAILMLFDPHLTLRGSGDLLFTLLGLQCAGLRRTTLAGDTQPRSEPTRVGNRRLPRAVDAAASVPGRPSLHLERSWPGSR